MAKRNQSPFEDLIQITSMMPWWAGVSLALIAYFLLHSIAMQPVPATLSVADAGQMVVNQLWRTLALFGQYLLPLALLIGAMVSVIGRIRRKKLLAGASNATAHGSVKNLSWREFEMLIGEFFRAKGFKVTETAKGADGGVDLELRLGSELQLVQCKHWRSTTVGVGVIRELFGVMAARGAAGGYVVTSGEYSRDAKAFAKGRNITLIGGELLDVLLRRSIDRGKFQPGTHTDKSDMNTARKFVNPTCPACGSPMVKRVAQRGPNAGSEFLGCSRYPQCRKTLSI